METPKIFESEYRFCQILWEHEPIRSTELVHLCAEKLGWKKATTYTVIRRLAQRGVLKVKTQLLRLWSPRRMFRHLSWMPLYRGLLMVLSLNLSLPLPAANL